MRLRGARPSWFASPARVAGIGLLVCFQFGSGCTLLLSKADSQCSTDADCTARGPTFAGLVCDGRSCVTPESLGCTTNLQCIQRNGGQPYICRKNERRCIALTSEDCTGVAPRTAIENDNVVLIASLQPTIGPDQSTGMTTQNSVELAINEFEQYAKGLPGSGTARRPLAVVQCNDAADEIRAAKHLVEQVRVPAIIGCNYSGRTINVATKVTIQAGVLLISASATSTAITDLDDNGLVWRTAPSDELQSTTVALYMPTLEARVRKDKGIPDTEPLRVAMVYKGDAYGTGLFNAILPKFKFNGKSASDPANEAYFLNRKYPNTDEAEFANYDFSADVQKIVDFKPHIAILFGANEAVVQLMGGVEKLSPSLKPYYVFGDGGIIPETLDAVTADPNLRLRVRGTVPGTDGALFRQFLLRYNASFDASKADPQNSGGSSGYDAAYLIAYSIVAAGNVPLTGQAIAGGLKKMVPPAQLVEVGPNNINSAFATLTAGQGINFEGASGPLDFDVKTGEAVSDIQLWCAKKNDAGKFTFGYVGAFYNASKKGLDGVDTCND